MTRWNETNSRAVFSPCRKYRYELWRHLPVPGGMTIAFIGLNPSTADETTDDRTVAKCWRWAEKWGFRHFCMLNIFAFRATDPKVMFAEPSPVADQLHSDANDRAIEDVCMRADVVVAAWGAHGNHHQRDVFVRHLILKPMMHKVHHLGLTKDGLPRHPLYLKNDIELQHWY